MRAWIRRNAGRLVALAIVGMLFASPVAALLWMTAVPGTSWQGRLPPLRPEERDLADRLRRHVAAIGGRPHNIGHPKPMPKLPPISSGRWRGRAMPFCASPLMTGMRSISKR